MTLRDLLGDGPDDVEITGLAYDNRAVAPGTLFFCVPGFTRDGHDFAPDAIERGATASRAKSCPSRVKPGTQKNSVPGSTLRLSKASPVISTSGPSPSRSRSVIAPQSMGGSGGLPA